MSTRIFPVFVKNLVQEHTSLSFQRLKNEISKEKNPYSDTTVRELQQHVNEEGYMGAVLNKNEIDEQQLSGHGCC